MRTVADRLPGALFHGWVELLTLLLVLFVVLTLWGWAFQRGLRPAERGAATPWGTLLASFGLVLVLRAVQGDWAIALCITLGTLLGGLLARTDGRSTMLWVPGMLLAGLVGLGWMLSAIVLALTGFLILLFQRRA